MFLKRNEIKASARETIKHNWFLSALAVFLVALSILVLFNLLNRVFFSLGIFALIGLSPLIVNLSGFFLRIARKDNPTVGDAFNVFTPTKNVPFMLAFWWKLLWVFLWSLLLIVPAIIKGIAYSFAFFIVCENPAIGIRKAMKLSIALTSGHKWEIFVLFLSFIPLFLLCLVTFGIALIYVLPYVRTTYALYYDKLKERAIAEEKVDASDFVIGER